MSDNARGALWMVLAMAAFAVEDAALKAAAQTLPLWQVMAMFGLGGAVIFAALARARGQGLWPAMAHPAMRLRAVFEVTGRLFYTLAIVLTPLSSATVILQATPIVVVASAALFMGEKVGWRRWAAIFAGLAGVVIVVQPGADSFSALSLLAVIGVLGFAGRDLASRAAPRALGSAVLGFWGFVAVALCAALYAPIEGAPPALPGAAQAGALLLAIVTGVLAYSALMNAMRTGQVAAVTPFRYSRLLFGIVLGVVVFGEPLTPSMLLGSAVIVAAGLFLLVRGNRAQAVSAGSSRKA